MTANKVASRFRGGYAGIVMILVTAVLIFLWIYYYSPLAPSKQGEPTKRSIGLDAIDDAQQIKDATEKQYRDMGDM